MTKDKKLSIHELVHLGHELDDIANKLNAMAKQLNWGVVDRDFYKTTMRQIEKCHSRLRSTFGQQQ